MSRSTTSTRKARKATSKSSPAPAEPASAAVDATGPSTTKAAGEGERAALFLRGVLRAYDAIGPAIDALKESSANLRSARKAERDGRQVVLMEGATEPEDLLADTVYRLGERVALVVLAEEAEHAAKAEIKRIRSEGIASIEAFLTIPNVGSVAGLGRNGPSIGETREKVLSIRPAFLTTEATAETTSSAAAWLRQTIR